MLESGLVSEVVFQISNLEICHSHHAHASSSVTCRFIVDGPRRSGASSSTKGDSNRVHFLLPSRTPMD